MLILILISILIFVVFCNYFFLNNIFLKTNPIKLAFSIFFIIIFTYFFVYFVRYLSFFREVKPVDIKNLITNSLQLDFFSIILILITIYFVRNLIINILKFCFLNVHYFILSCDKNRFYLKLYFFINKIPTNVRLFFFKKKYNVDFFLNFFYFFFKYYFVTAFLTLLILELFLNSFVLDLSLRFVPYFGFYSFIYQFIHYVVYKIDTQYDKKLSDFFYAKKTLKYKGKRDLNDSYALYLYINNKLFK